MEFNVDVNIVPHGQEKIDEIEQKIKSLQGKSVKIDFDTSGISGLDKLISGNSSQYKKAGQNIGTQISQGINSGIGKASVSSASEFSKTQQKMRKDIKDTADELGKIYPDLSESDAKKDAQGYYSAVAKEQERANKEIQKATEKARCEAEQSASKRNSSLETYIDSEKGDAILSRMRKQMESYAGQSTPNIEKANGLMQEFSSSLVALKDHKSGTSILDDESLDNTIQKLQKAETSFKNVFSQIKDETSKTLGLGVAEQSANKVASYYESNSKAVKKYGATLKELEQQYRQVTTVEEKATLDTSFKNLQSRISAEGLTGKSGIDEFKRAAGQIAQFAGIYGMIQNVAMEVPSKIIDSVKDVNAAQIELRKVSDASESDLSQYWDTASESAKKYGASISDVISSTADWSRLGYNLDDAKQLSDATTLLQKVGDKMTQESSSQGMISTLKGFQMDADEASSIVDKVNEVANTEPIDTSGLFAGLERSASSMNAANNSLEQTIALITAANSVVQDPDSVGTAFKTISMRIRGADTELQQAGLDTEGMAESTAKLREEVMALSGVDIMKNDNEFKSTYDILDELANKWSDLTDIQQASLTELIAGKRQGNIVSSLMTNFDIARKTLDTALNGSEGSAEKELSNYQQGIEYSLDKLQANFQDFSNTLVDSKAIKGFVDGGSNLLNLFTKLTSSIGTLNTAAIGLGIFQGKTGSGKSTWEFAPCIFQMTYAA